MKTNMHDRVQKLKNEGYDLDFSKVLTETIELYKKTFAWSALAIFVILIFAGPCAFGIMFMVFGKETLASGNPDLLQISALSPNQLMLYMGSFAVLSTLTTPFHAGLIEMPHRADKKKHLDLGTAFTYYSSRKFWRLLLLGLVVAVISISVSTGIELLNFPGFAAVNFFLSVMFGCLTMLAIPLVIFADLGPLDALSASCAIVSKQFMLIFGLYIIAFVALIIGVLTCCIGLLFTLAFLFALIYTLYDNILGFPGGSSIDITKNVSPE